MGSDTPWPTAEDHLYQTNVWTVISAIAVNTKGHELYMGSDTPWPTADDHLYQTEVWTVISVIAVNTKISDIIFNGQRGR
ncbi:hypothetical protein DPMN_173638 [Dreissena polymorpha]|uniref:Uncharacterized protein n=1 Tax=Dreissena polymorpha TaxID=45954 RepID=A0A9D4E4H2_DREPO|nr:hypothetical protein DPMN_173638 [Dreissena polymorpha]